MNKKLKTIFFLFTFIFLIIVVENKSYAAERLESNFTGIYIGKLTAYNDPLGFDELKFEIDHNEYYLYDGDTSELFKTQNEVWLNSIDKTVVCKFVNGKIKRMDIFKDVIKINMISCFEPDSFIYQNSNYQNKEIIMKLKVEYFLKGNSEYTSYDLQNAIGIPKIKKINMSIESDNVIFSSNNSSSISDTINLDVGKNKTVTYKLKIHPDYIPDKLVNKIEIKKTALLDSSVNIPVVSSYFNIANMDIQKKLDETKNPTKLQKIVNEAKTSLNENIAVAVDSNLNYYFDNSQMKEINKYLTVWLSEIINAQQFNKLETSLSESVQKEVQKTILKKLGVSIDSKFFVSTTDASTIIEEESAKFGKIKIKIMATVTGFSMDSDSSAFASLGSIEYEIIKCEKKSSYPKSGTAIVTSTKLNEFAKQVKKISDNAIQGTYNNFWGTDVNKIAELYINTPFNKLLAGKISDNFYKMLKLPTNDYLKKVSVKCPVDIYIYDWDGNLCAEIKNNAITDNAQNLYINIEDDDKYIYLTSNDYVIKLIGNDVGEMEYSVELYKENESSRVITTNKVPLSLGKEYYSIVPDCELDGSVYSLTNDESTTLKISSDSEKWSGEISPNFEDGDGSKNNPFLISNASQLAKISQDVRNGNNYSEKYFKLISDIVLEDREWEPIGYWKSEDNYSYFKGNFDGNNYTIFIYNTNIYGGFEGLFGDIDNAIIENLTIVIDREFTDYGEYYNLGNYFCGAIAAYVENNSIVRNCEVAGSLTVNNNRKSTKIGGIVGYTETSTIENCNNYCSIYVDMYDSIDAGGIVGQSAKNSIISKCNNFGEIKGNFYHDNISRGDIGGITASNSGKISECINYGVINASGAYSSTGGIVGIGTGTIEKCINIAELNGYGIGGIGCLSSGSILNCRNDGKITGREVAGICQYLSSNNGLIRDCSNNGQLCGESVGGIVGSAESATIENSYNTGSISGSETYDLLYGGGIVERAYSSHINNVYSVGTISSKDSNANVGYIIGLSNWRYDGKGNEFHNIYCSQTDKLSEMGIIRLDTVSNFGLLDSNTLSNLNKWVANQTNELCYWIIDGNKVINNGKPYLKQLDKDSIKFNKNSIELKSNDQFQLSLIADLEITYSQLSWYSSDDDVATINDEGVITATDNGITNIICIIDDVYVCKCQVNVNNKIDNATLFLFNDTFIYDGNAKTPEVTVKINDTILIPNEDYTISYRNNINAGIASIDVTGIGKYIGTKTYNFTIDKAYKEIHTEASSYNKKIDDSTFKIEATTLPEEDLIFTSSNEDVVIVDENGYVTIVGAGQTTIIVTSPESQNYKEANSVSVTVNISKLDKTILIPTTTINAQVGDNDFSLNANIVEGEVLSYSSSNVAVAEVNSNGVIKVKSEGTTIITISSFETLKYYEAQCVFVTINVSTNLNADTDNGTNGGNTDNGTNSGNTDNGTNGGNTDNGTNMGNIDNDSQDKIPNAKKLKNGDKVKIGNTTYTIINIKKKEVSYTKTKSKASKLTIPPTVIISGIKYKVTKIADNAFTNNKRITQVIIGKNISVIGKNAFKGCTKLKGITLTENVKSIGANAFSGDKKLTTLTIVSNKLTKKGVKNSLKGSYIKTIRLKGTAKKTYKKYCQYFKKDNSGRSVKIKK